MGWMADTREESLEFMDFVKRYRKTTVGVEEDREEWNKLRQRDGGRVGVIDRDSCMNLEILKGEPNYMEFSARRVHAAHPDPSLAHRKYQISKGVHPCFTVPDPYGLYFIVINGFYFPVYKRPWEPYYEGEEVEEDPWENASIVIYTGHTRPQRHATDLPQGLESVGSVCGFHHTLIDKKGWVSQRGWNRPSDVRSHPWERESWKMDYYWSNYDGTFPLNQRLIKWRETTVFDM